MAHSVQVLDGRAFRANDADLLAMIALIRCRDFVTGSHSVRRMLDHWERALSGYGPGTLRLELARFLETEVARQEFCMLMAETKVHAESFGLHVPSDLIQAKMAADIIRFLDYPVELITSVVAGLQELVAPGAQGEDIGR